MSNEYIVVNTNKNNQTIWSTIASTYTPSAGEVCVIVPTANALEYSISPEDQHKEYDLSNVGVAIKIGDGETVFKDLPILTDVSTIHPDWHETDTSSPNYIWHKPLTNNDMFVQSVTKALVLEDWDILEIMDKVKNGETKLAIFHDEEYYYIKSLDSTEFRHPNDLLIEEDNTWGHYDIFYSHDETNHEPRYFYQNNILRLTDALKYIENNTGYNYKLEIYLNDLILDVFRKYKNYASVFNFIIQEIPVIPNNINLGDFSTTILYKLKDTDKYYWYKEENGIGSFVQIEYYLYYRISNYISAIANAIGDELFKHNGAIEQVTIYDILSENIELCYDQLLLRQLSGHIYQSMFEYENRNHIEQGVIEGIRTYYEINDELIIDTNYTVDDSSNVSTSSNNLYIKKSRLDHFYYTAHGVSEWTEIVEPGTKILRLPFKVTPNMKFGDDYNVILQNINDGYVQKISQDDIGTAGVSILTYPFKTLMAGSVKDEIGNLNTTIVFDDYTYTKEFSINEPTNTIPLPEGCDFTESSFVKIYYDKNDITWEDDYSTRTEEDLQRNPIISLTYKEGLDISKNLSNTKITLYTNLNSSDGTPPDSKVLKYFDDYLLTSEIDNEGNFVPKLVLINAIIEPCKIEYVINYPEVEIKDYTWTRIPNESGEGLEESSVTIPAVTFKDVEVEGDFIIVFKEIGGERNLQYYNIEDNVEVQLQNAPNGFTLNESGNLVLNQPITKPCTINYNRLQGLSLNESDINIATGEIDLKDKNLISQTIVYYRKNNLGEGNLKIKIYYKTRSLDAKFLSSLRPNWNTNDNRELTYIFNRPLWLDTPADAPHQIVMPMKNGLYSNGEKTYYEFFEQMIKTIVDEFFFDGQLQDVWDAINAILAWKDRIEDYVDSVIDYSKKDKNGNEYGPGVVNALDQIIDKVAELDDRVKFLEGRSEVWVGDKEPSESWYKIWINTSAGNGNGLLYYYNYTNNVWTPISAMWSNSDGSQNI